MTIKKGDTARLVQPEIKGTVIDRRINAETDEIELLLEWPGADGEIVQRWFDADKLEPAGEREFVANPAEVQP